MSEGGRPAAEDPEQRGPGARRRIEPPSLMDLLGPADDTDVLDGPAGHQRMTRDAVTDAGGAPVETERAADGRPPSGDSSFQFDLGGALARLAVDEPAPAPAPPATRADVPAAPAAPPSHQAVPPLVDESTVRHAEPAVTPPPVPSPPPSSPATRPIEPMTYESVTREPSAPHTPRPPVAEPATVVQPPVAAPAPIPEPAPVVQPAAAAPAPVAEPAPVAPPPVAEPAPDQPQEYPRRVPGTHFDTQMRSAPEPMPEIHEATPPAVAPRPAARSSVFDDVQAGAPPTLPAASAPSMPTAAPSMPTAAPSGHVAAPGAAPSIMPSLPASNPAAPPPVAEPVSSAVSTPDINALRSAQLRASKQQRQGKMFGRSLLAFVVIAGLIAGALVFGRSLLFDTEWDAQLTPLVNEIEAERGQFDHTVPLVVVPAAELGDRLRAATIGDAWVERVPEWRALGLATGSVDAASVGAAIAGSTTAVYDPTGDQIYQLEGVDPAVAPADLRVALERAFDAQFAPAVPADDVGDSENGDNENGDSENSDGLTGVSSLESIATRAVDQVLASGGSVGVREPADDTLPMPIAYELAAVKVLGEPILSAVGLDPATYKAAGPYPETIATVLDDNAAPAAGALIQPGEVSIAAPRALGTDDWSLVWGARLPAPTVDLLVGQVIADSYRPVQRGESTCFVAVFETADEAGGNSVFASLLTWAANSPPTSQAVATSLGSTRVQLDACDPGADAASPPNAGVVDSLIDRQQRRLTN